MYLAYKFRMYPNQPQIAALDNIFEACRFVYNYYLSQYENNPKLSASECIVDFRKNLKSNYPIFNEINNHIITKTIYKLFDNIKREAKRNKALPKYKEKHYRNSFVIQNYYDPITDDNTIRLNLKKHEIAVANFTPIKIRCYNNLNNIAGKILNVVISKEPTGKYYVSVQCELETTVKISNPKTIVGIDMGLTTLLTLSDGTTYPNKRFIEQYENEIEKYQKLLGSKKKGSENYTKSKQKLARAYAKLKNARKFYIHQITKEIVDKYDIIVCETLGIKHMIMDNTCTKSIIDATLAEIIKQLEYKSKKYGKYFYQVPKYYPSSQICSVCNNKDTKYRDYSLRTYKCSKCGNEMDRDLNASINIKNEGIKIHENKIYHNKNNFLNN